jgi:hypothetical protein
MPKKKRRKQSPRTISTDHIETRSLSLVDEFGTTRAELICDCGADGTGGYTIFRLNGGDGMPRLTIQLGPGGEVGIHMFAGVQNRRSIVSLAASEAGSGISIRSEDGRSAIAADVPSQRCEIPPGGQPHIHVFNRDGKSAYMDGNGLSTYNRDELAAATKGAPRESPTPDRLREKL